MKGVIAMSDFKKYLAQQMEDPAFAAEYEAQRLGIGRHKITSVGFS